MSPDQKEIDDVHRTPDDCHRAVDPLARFARRRGGGCPARNPPTRTPLRASRGVGYAPYGFPGVTPVSDKRAPRPPAGLDTAGRAVWRRILGDLPDEWELDARELLILEAAARQADLNRALEVALSEDGVRVLGSSGQPRLNAVATELRQGHVALGKLLEALALPGDEGGGALTAQQKRAQAAADARWLREGKGRRRGAA